MKFKIAVVQMEVKPDSPAFNLKKADKYAKRAAQQGAQIVVFPEGFLSDPIVKGQLRVSPLNLRLKQIRELAKRYRIDLVGSISEVDKGILHNTAYYIDSDGKILSRYRKKHLWLPADKVYAPGRKETVFHTRYGKFALIICWDLMFEEVFQRIVRKGGKVVICPSNWFYGDAHKIGQRYDQKSEAKLIDSLCTGRAFENEIVFVFCNSANKWKKDKSVGHSQITVPFKGVLGKLNHSNEAMLVREIDTNILGVAEKVYKIRKELQGILLE